MTINIPNLNRLISYLEALPPEEFNMKNIYKIEHSCGTACCILGHAISVWEYPFHAGRVLGFTRDEWNAITMPYGYNRPEKVVAEHFPLSRALRMLRHLRAEFIRSGTVVVDWDAPEAVEPPRKAWAPPLVIGADKELPVSLTRLVREPATSAEV